ncbi:MAG TPA: zf-HC2 domain-containing protein [Gaiellales bacterium]|nr:zf-HC2 domain-containing protein [Gaiellales bacterium]
MASPSRLDCDGARALASQALDLELSELERAALASHLRRCGDCARFEQCAGWLADAVRAAAPAEPVALPQVRGPRRRRARVARRGAGVAAAVAAAFALGVFTAGSRTVHQAPEKPPQLVALRSLGQDMLIMRSERQPFDPGERWPLTRLPV